MNNIFELKKGDFFFAIKPKVYEIETLLNKQSDIDFEAANEIIFSFNQLVYDVFEKVDYSKFTNVYTHEFQKMKVCEYTRTFDYENSFDDVKEFVICFIEGRSGISEYIDTTHYMKSLMLLKAFYAFINGEVDTFGSNSPKTTGYAIIDNQFTIFIDQDDFHSEYEMVFFSK